MFTDLNVFGGQFPRDESTRSSPRMKVGNAINYDGYKTNARVYRAIKAYKKVARFVLRNTMKTRARYGRSSY